MSEFVMLSLLFLVTLTLTVECSWAQNTDIQSNSREKLQNEGKQGVCKINGSDPWHKNEKDSRKINQLFFKFPVLKNTSFRSQRIQTQDNKEANHEIRDTLKHYFIFLARSCPQTWMKSRLMVRSAGEPFILLFKLFYQPITEK